MCCTHALSVSHHNTSVQSDLFQCFRQLLVQDQTGQSSQVSRRRKILTDIMTSSQDAAWRFITSLLVVRNIRATRWDGAGRPWRCSDTFAWRSCWESEREAETLHLLFGPPSQTLDFLALSWTQTLMHLSGVNPVEQRIRLSGFMFLSWELNTLLVL